VCVGSDRAAATGRRCPRVRPCTRLPGVRPCSPRPGPGPGHGPPG